MNGFLWFKPARPLQVAMGYFFIVIFIVSLAYPGGTDLLAFFHTPPLAGNLVTFEDRSLGLTIKYPSNWERSKIGQDQVTFIAPRESDSSSFPAGLGIKSHNISSADSTLDDIAKEIVTDLKDDTQDFTLLSSGKSKLNNFDAHEISFSATDDNDAKRTAMQIVVKPGNMVYVITYKAYPEKYESYLPIIQSMLDSLKFL
ncbi:MAG TPA: PsbP-related protein [Nitrososphaeraceae archaeon]|nr:PsbP-related protein [Nitrososphaeraceae archaeon]